LASFDVLFGINSVSFDTAKAVVVITTAFSISIADKRIVLGISDFLLTSFVLEFSHISPQDYNVLLPQGHIQNLFGSFATGKDLFGRVNSAFASLFG